MAGDAYYANTSLLLSCNSVPGIADRSAAALTVTAQGNAAISSSQYAPLTGNTESLALDGTGDYLLVNDSTALAFGSGDFTIEFWLRFPSAAVVTGLIAKRTASTVYAPFHLVLDTSAIKFYASVNGSSWTVNALSSGALAINTWHHISVTRSGTSVRMFANGTLISTVTLSGSLVASTSAMTIGRNANNASPGASDYSGNLDDIRFTKGIARYTATFTRPSTPNLLAGQLSGAISETTAITDWRVTATRCRDGASVATVITTGASYTADTTTLEVCNLTLAPKVDQSWRASTIVALGELWVPSNSDSTQRLFKCTTAGTTAGTEPTWPSSGTVTDGSVVWTYVDALIDPITLGPYTPS